MNPRPLAGGADLHVHTTHSDGSCSPGEVVRAAAQVGLDALAITDHDTISALAIARPEADRCGIELVNGVELTAEFLGREFHILGHFFRDDDPDLSTACRDFRERRNARIVAMSDRLAGLGLRIDLPALRKHYPRATIGRRHLADWLARTGQVRSRDEAFATFLGDVGPAQVPKPRFPIAEAIHLIRRAGGVAGLAHPPYDLRGDVLEAMTAMGLGSIEVGGFGTPKNRAARLLEWGDRLGLIPIAGTDFHAPDRPGRWVGAITTPGDRLDRLRAAGAQALAL